MLAVYAESTGKTVRRKQLKRAFHGCFSVFVLVFSFKRATAETKYGFISVSKCQNRQRLDECQACSCVSVISVAFSEKRLHYLNT